MKSATTALIASLGMLLPISSHAEDGVVLDYADFQFRMANPGINAARKAKIAAALKPVSNPAVKALGKDFVVLGDTEGELSKAGEVDFYLLSTEAPVAIEPFPNRSGQVILAMKGKEAIGTYNLPKDIQYARMVGAVDVDGDRSSELLLEASSMNMGEIHTMVHAVKLEAENGTRQMQAVEDVYLDTCEAPHGEKLRSAKTISLKSGKLVAETRKEKCSQGG